jgi:hypothetical protein
MMGVRGNPGKTTLGTKWDSDGRHATGLFVIDGNGRKCVEETEKTRRRTKETTTMLEP